MRVTRGNGNILLQMDVNKISIERDFASSAVKLYSVTTAINIDINFIDLS